jgi:predicted RNase H-like HicB family nuclease
MQYIYPAVVYKESEENLFVMVLPDVNIVCEGNSIEEALIEAKDQLKIYLKCVIQFGANLARATDFEQFREEHKDDILLLVECDVDDEKDDIVSILF